MRRRILGSAVPIGKESRWKFRNPELQGGQNGGLGDIRKFLFASDRMRLQAGAGQGGRPFRSLRELTNNWPVKER